MVCGSQLRSRSGQGQYLVPADVIIGRPPVVPDDVDDFSICQDVGRADNLAIDLSCHHLIPHIRVYVVGEVHHCSTLCHPDTRDQPG